MMAKNTRTQTRQPAASKPAAASESQKADEENAKIEAQEKAQADAEQDAAEARAKAEAEQEAADKQNEAAAATMAPQDESSIEGLWIRSLPATFRRAGHQFNRRGHGIALEALTPEQIEALENEPNLVVERVTFTDAALPKP